MELDSTFLLSFIRQSHLDLSYQVAVILHPEKSTLQNDNTDHDSPQAPLANVHLSCQTSYHVQRTWPLLVRPVTHKHTGLFGLVMSVDAYYSESSINFLVLLRLSSSAPPGGGVIVPKDRSIRPDRRQSSE